MQRNQDRYYENQVEDEPSDNSNSAFDWIPESNEIPIHFYNRPIRISRELLQRKYFEAFNFYFSKPINEILANLSLPHVILYKDFLYYDDDSEYLKRYYRTDEVPPRLHNLSKFYSNTAEGLTKPNLAVHEQNKIILKRNNKLHKYYLTKLQNFADIPQTQRNHKPKEDFKILNNLHDDEGYSEDIYSHEHRNYKKEERSEKQTENDNDHDQIHNSFQQMLERYENATAKLSFESQQHNVYDPEYSTDSPKVVNRSTEDNLSFDKSLEIYVKDTNPGFDLFEKDIFVDSKSIEIVEEHHHHDQIPHNISDFGFSDASEINLINEIVRSSKDEHNFRNNIVQEALVFNEKPKAPSKQKQTEDSDKSKSISTQKSSTQHKTKSTSAKHVDHKKSDSFTTKKSKASMEKVRASKEFDIIPHHAERNVNRDHYAEKPSDYASAKRVKGEDLYTDKSATSARNTEFYEKLSPREMQYPIISIKNIQINQIKQSEPSSTNNKMSTATTATDEKNISGKSRKSSSGTNPVKKSTSGTGSMKKLSLAGESKTVATDKPMSSATSIQYIKGLMEKYQKYSDEIVSNRAKASANFEKPQESNTTDKRYKDTQEDETPKYTKSGDVYVSNELYTRVANKKSDPKAHHLSRSKTEDALFKDISNSRSKKLSKESPTKMFENGPNSARRIVMSPSNPRKDKQTQRFGSNEGISPRLIASTTLAKFPTQLSSDNSKLLQENLSDDKLLSSGVVATSNGNNLKSVKVEKVFAYKRSEMKPPMKTNGPKNEANNSNSSNTRRLTAAHTYSGASSVERNDLVISMPVSPTKRFDLKLNLNRLNQVPGKYPNDTPHTENSYGFWTSRSAKIGLEEESRLLKNGGMTEDRYKYDSVKKDYLLKKNYDPYAEAKKKGKGSKKVGSYTNLAANPGLKTRETDGPKNPILLKSADNEADMRQIYIHDLNDVNSIGRIPATARASDLRTDTGYSAKNDHRRSSKK